MIPHHRVRHHRGTLGRRTTLDHAVLDVLPLALAGGGKFRTLTLTEHTKTNIEMISKFLPVEIRTTEIAGDTVEIEVTT